jgi:DNA (cytosine-5)-methyltransferase 1
MAARKLTVASLFAGAGGMDLGFLQAGFQVVWANEAAPDACATYRDNVGGHLVQGDIHDIPSSAVPECDVVIGGPPCQGFSVAGKMDPHDPRSRLIWQMARVIRDRRPRAFVLENVKALGMLERWRSVREALVDEMERLGYSVSFRILDASEHGAPQQRERVFFVGVRGGRFEFPSPQARRPSVREALEALPEYGRPGNDSLCRARITPARRPVLRRSPFAGMLFNGLGRPIDLGRPSPTLPASMGGNKTPIIDQVSLTEGAEPWVVGYHAHLMSGGPPAASAPARLRRLTVEECAALQTFPPGMRFHGGQSSRYTQIGNAVPPALARALARQLLRALSA